LSTGKYIKIEDIAFFQPVNEKSEGTIKISKSFKNDKTAIRNKKSKKYNFILENDDNSKLLDELLQNPCFAITPVKNLNNFNTAIIESWSKNWHYGASRYNIDFRQGYGKWFFKQNVLKNDIHDRWNYVIMEDFDTDSSWPTNSSISIDIESDGYGKQELTITWKEVGGTWRTLTNEYLVGTQSLQNTATYGDDLFIGGFKWWSDYTVSCWIYQDTPTDSWSGIIFRYQDTDNYYALVYDNSGTTIKFKTKINGSSTYYPYTINNTADNWHQLKVECYGNKIQVYYDGELLGKHIVNDLSSGKVGCYSHHGIDWVLFDDFRVTLGKPISFNLPSDTEWHNQYEHTTVNTAHGTQKKLVAPDNDVQFTLGASDDDCILWLKMNEGEGSVIYDYSKNKWNGVFINQGNGVDWADDDEKGNCIYFDGSENVRIDVPDWNPGTVNQYTIDFEFKASRKSYGYMVNPAFQPLLYTSNHLFWYYNVSPDLFYINVSNWNINTWYRMSIIVNNDHNWAKCYLDGKLVGMITGSGVDPLGASYLCIGNDLSNPDREYYGYIRNLRIYQSVRWDVALGCDQTPATVFVYDNKIRSNENYPNDEDCRLLLHMDEGSGTTVYNAAGEDLDGTLVNSPTWTGTSFRGEAGTCLYFNSSNSEYISIPDSNEFSFVGASIDVPFSIEAWFKLNSLPSAGSTMCIISKWATSGNQREWRLFIDNSDYINIQIAHSDYSEYIGCKCTTTVITDKWYHIVATYDGSEKATGFKLYVDGNIVSDSDIDSGSYTGMTNGTSAVCIGKIIDGNYFDGYIDEVRIHRRELSAEEIAARFRSEPYLHDWYQMQRVYSKQHDWEGTPVIHNGLIMLAFPEYDLYQVRVNDVLLPCVYAWYENSWHLLGYINPFGGMSYGSEWWINMSYSCEWDIVELTDQQCTIKITYQISDQSDHPEGSKLDTYLTVRNGFPGVLVETDDRDWHKSDEIGFIFVQAIDYGIGEKNPFMFVPENHFENANIDGHFGSYQLNTVEDNWLMWFGLSTDSNAPSKNKIICMATDGYYDDLGSTYQWYANDLGDNYNYTYCRNTKKGVVFFVPYDIDKLFTEMDDGEDQVDVYEIDTGGTFGNGTTGDYSSNNYTTYTTPAWTSGSGVVWQGPITLEKGSYCLIMRMKASGRSLEDIYIGVDDGGNNARAYSSWTEGYKKTSKSSSWYYDTFFFHSDGSSNYYIKCELEQRDSGVGTSIELAVDYAVIIPLSNGITYPSDIAHQSLNVINLKRGLKK